MPRGDSNLSLTRKPSHGFHWRTDCFACIDYQPWLYKSTCCLTVLCISSQSGCQRLYNHSILCKVDWINRKTWRSCFLTCFPQDIGRLIVIVYGCLTQFTYVFLLVRHLFDDCGVGGSVYYFCGCGGNVSSLSGDGDGCPLRKWLLFWEIYCHVNMTKNGLIRYLRYQEGFGQKNKCMTPLHRIKKNPKEWE